MTRPLRVVVNAVPMTNIHTGISRYMRCLYAELERLYPGELDIQYFDGRALSPTPPGGPRNEARWAKLVDLFWKLPAYPALAVRQALHWRRELLFRKLAQGFDLYHEAGFFPYRVPKGVRTLFTVHDLSVLRHPECHPKERVLYYKLFFKQRCGLADHFLAVSDFTKREMVAVLGTAAADISVGSEAHDAEAFKPQDPDEVRRVRHKLDVPEAYFLFVGSGDPRKNADVVPKALAAASVDTPLVWAGWSGWSQDAADERVVRLGYVSDTDLAALYAGARALVFPSSYEGFGLPVLEAMACGCPVLTTRGSSLPEVGGEAALYVDNPRDEAEVGAALARLDTDAGLRNSLREAGLARVLDFSWERAARETHDAFQLALRGRSDA